MLAKKEKKLKAVTKADSSGTASKVLPTTSKGSRRSSVKKEVSSLSRLVSLESPAVESLTSLHSWPSTTKFLTSTRSKCCTMSRTGTKRRRPSTGTPKRRRLDLQKLQRKEQLKRPRLMKKLVRLNLLALRKKSARSVKRQAAMKKVRLLVKRKKVKKKKRKLSLRLKRVEKLLQAKALRKMKDRLNTKRN